MQKFILIFFPYVLRITLRRRREREREKEGRKYLFLFLGRDRDRSEWMTVKSRNVIVKSLAAAFSFCDYYGAIRDFIYFFEYIQTRSKRSDLFLWTQHLRTHALSTLLNPCTTIIVFINKSNKSKLNSSIDIDLFNS